MSDTLPQLFTIFIGICIVAIGLYIIRSTMREGFTEGSDSMSEHAQLTQKLTEIQAMYTAIAAKKPKHDLALNGILDADTMNTLDILMNELKFFDKQTPSPELEIFHNNFEQFETLTTEEQDVLRTMIYVAHQEASLLYNIYVTMPAIIISTGTIVDTEAATVDSLTEDAVGKELKATIMKSLQGIPSIGAKLEASSKKFTDTALEFTELTALQNEFVKGFHAAFKEYYRIIKLKVDSYKKQISLQKATTRKLSIEGGALDTVREERADANILSQEAIQFIQVFLESVEPVGEKVTEFSKKYSESTELLMLDNAIRSAIQSMTLTKNSMSYTATMGLPSTMPKEGFATQGMPTHNHSQGINFRLGKQGLVDEVARGSLLR